MKNLSQISSVHWQYSLTHTGIVEDAEDIEQALRIILGTPKGSDPHRPDFGSNLHLYIDYPVDQALPYLVRESVDAISQWEPRCHLNKVIPKIESSCITLQISWQLDNGVVRETVVVL